MNKDQLTIGRNIRNDIQIDNLAVSNFHAKIKKYQGRYCIEDLDSTNGTFINDRRISKETLNDNDALTIGKHTLVFLLQGDDAADAGQDRRDAQLDKTMILDTRVHRERLALDDEEGDLAIQKGPLGVLTILEEGTGQREFVLTDRLTLVGKDSEAGVKLDGLLAPEIGGFVAREKNGYTLIPPDRSSRIKINGRAVKDSVFIQDADHLEIGGVMMRFHLKRGN
jgi:pSer/pThr/pTyr-binding forkhead associated (FHA) protein